jgi:hypothetical protein
VAGGSLPGPLRALPRSSPAGPPPSSKGELTLVRRCPDGELMIAEDFWRIWRCAKGEIPGSTSPPDRLIIEWTAQL